MTQTNKELRFLIREFMNDRLTHYQFKKKLYDWSAEQQKQHEEVIKEINLENGQLETDIDKLRQENQQLKAKIKEMEK